MTFQGLNPIRASRRGHDDQDPYCTCGARWKEAEGDLAWELLTHIARRLMDFEIEQRCRPAYDERTDELPNSRDGYRDRFWETRTGSGDLRIPNLRRRSYLPGFLKPRRTA
jgi:putative transposase